MEVRCRIVADRRQDAAVDRFSHWRTRLHDQSVDREVHWWPAADFARQHQVQVGLPLTDRLTGPAVNEVETDVHESRSSRGGDRSRDAGGLMQPAKHSQTAAIKRLRTNAETIHT